MDNNITTKKELNNSDKILIWTKTVEVQMHFNQICINIKSLALTAFTFIIAGIGYLYKEKIYLENINIIFWFSIIGLILILLFFFIDYYWYHRFLKATSSHLSYITANFDFSNNDTPLLNLNNKIADKSNETILGVRFSSNAKTRLFYIPLLIILAIISISSWVLFNKQSSINIIESNRKVDSTLNIINGKLDSLLLQNSNLNREKAK